jgi:hypothetical protein
MEGLLWPGPPPKGSQGTGDDCDKAKAKLKAQVNFATNGCAGASDPKCPSNGDCKAPAACQKVGMPGRDAAGPVENCTATQDDTCANGQKWHCVVKDEANATPVTCGCSCA